MIFGAIQPGVSATGMPVGTISAATNYNQNSAVFNGSINPKGYSTTVYFQYGTDPTFATYSTIFAGIFTGSTVQTCSASATGLTSSTSGSPTIYYVRLAATNVIGPILTSAVNFTTYKLITTTFTSNTTWTNPRVTSGVNGAAITSLVQILCVGGGGYGSYGGGAGGNLGIWSNANIAGYGANIGVYIGSGGVGGINNGGAFVTNAFGTSFGNFSAYGGAHGAIYDGGASNGHSGGIGNGAAGGGGAGISSNGYNASGDNGGNGGDAFYGLGGGGGGTPALFSAGVAGTPYGDGPPNTGRGGGGLFDGYAFDGGSGLAQIQYYGPY